MADADQYERMKLFIGHVTTKRMGIPYDSPIHPLAALVDIEAKFGRSKAKSGLKLAIHDTVESLAGLSSEDVSALDNELEQLGAMTLGEARAGFSKALKRVLARGAIQNEVEYYLVRNAVDFLSGDENSLCWAMLSAFEASQPQPN